MCGNASRLEYSPRRLVAFASEGGGGEGEGGAGAGVGGASAGGAEAPQPPLPSPGKAWRNLTQPMPLRRKMRLLVRNVSIRIKTRRDCCGNFGEPGC